MWNQPIIPPQMSKNILKIKGFLTIWDFIIISIIVSLSGLIAWSLPMLGWIWQSVIAIFIIMFCCLFLMPIKNKRIYIYIYLFIKFIFSNKNYQNQKANNTKLLIPYQKVVDNCLYTGNEYISAIKLQGFNLTNLEIAEQNIKIEKLQLLFKLIDTEMSLVKTEEPFVFKNNYQFLKNKSQLLKTNKFLNLNQQQIRNKQINHFLKDFSEQRTLSSNQLEKQFHLIIYSKTLQENKKWTNITHDKLQNVNLNPIITNHYQLINLIKQILNPYLNDFDNQTINHYKQDLTNLFKFEKLKFKADCVIIDDKYFAHTQIINNLPTFPCRAWALPLMDSDGVVIININPVKSNALKTKLSKSIINLATNINTTSKKDIVGRKKQEAQINLYQELVNQISYGNEIIKKINILIMHHGMSKKELLNKQRFFNNVLHENQMTSDRLIFEQIEGYSAILPKKLNPLDQLFSYEVPSLTLAEAFPFISNVLKDENGLYLGENLIGEPIILDQFKHVNVDKTRKNHNMLIIGQSGSGKSTLAKKIINFHLALGRKVIIIDPEREYKALCNYYHGNWIDIGNSTQGKINPLQILGTISEDEIILNKQTLISNHVQFLENWLAILFPDLKNRELRYFSIVLGKLYLETFKNYQDILNLKNCQYPTFDDLKQFMIKNNVSKSEHLVIYELITNEFTGIGKYNNLYNGHSTINTKDNLFHVFDINTLYEKGNPQIINAQLYLLTAFINHQIKDNGFHDKHQVIVLIDEAHLLIDTQKPLALNFIFQMVKRIRKCFGGVILVTQNPDDFLGSEEIRKKTMAIINNVQYSFIMNLSPKNLDDVHQLYKSFGGLSTPQLNFIAHAKVGDALLINGGFERHEVTIKISKFEKEVFDERIKND